MVYPMRHCRGVEPVRRLKYFTEEADIGEIQFIGNLRCLLVAMAQQYLGGGDDGTIYPFLRAHTAG